MQPYLEFREISKFFPGVRALDSISLSAEKGTVYALMGENGAGKSTLLKILNGDYIPDRGDIVLDGKPVRFSRPKDAIENGISTIYQERQVLQEMTVAENVFLGDWPRNKSGIVNTRAMNKATSEIAARFGLDVKPEAKVRNLSVAMQQMVEIMKAVRRDAQIIAFDEPTASLSAAEIDILFTIIRQLQAENRVVFYVSHRMNEVGQIAQKVIVFKDGRLVGEREQSKVTQDELIQMMVGRKLEADMSAEYSGRKIGEPVLECSGISTDYVGRKAPVSFTVRAGEILGFAGLVGAGRTEIMRAIYGVDKLRSGTITLSKGGFHTRPCINSPKEAIEHGIVMVSEDRKDQGVLPNISIKGNISVSILKEICKGGMINFAEEESIAQAAVKKFDIRTPDTTRLLLQLSGGNQQKTILARYLQCKPSVLILDEPTKGIDVGAKSEFHRIIFECAAQGMAILVVSSELPELIPLCDRIIVVRDGALAGELQKAEFSEEAILKLAMPGENN